MRDFYIWMISFPIKLFDKLGHQYIDHLLYYSSWPQMIDFDKLYEEKRLENPAAA